MFVVGEDQKRPPKGRTKSETAFKRINNCVLLVQLATFLTVTTLVTISAGKTLVTPFWNFNQELVLDTTIEAKTINCTMNVTLGAGGWNAYPQVISKDDFMYRLAWFSGSVRTSLIVVGMSLILGALNKVLMEMNVMELKIKALVLRKEILTTIEIMMLVVGLWYIALIETDAETLRQYMKHCGVTSQTYLPFMPPFVALYIGLIWTLLIHALSFVALMWAVCVKPPPYNTTRDHFQRKLTQAVKVHAQEVEQTNPYPENANFQSAVDFANMPMPQDAEDLGPVMGAYSHATVGPTPPVSPSGDVQTAPHF